jgi:polysaccharide chain length determinant protein (PEP-CTERM system associated)
MPDLRSILLGHLDALWHRRWAGVAIAWAVCACGWAVASMMPNRFQAEARIYVDTDTLLAPLLQGLAVRPNIDQQVQIMQRTLLSRPNLEQVMRMSDLDLQVQGPAQREALLDRLQRSTTMRAESARNLFRLTHDDGDPRTAQRVVQSLLTIFVEGQLGSKRRDMVQAQGFIDHQIREYETSLQAAEQRLAEFRQRHMDVVDGGLSFGQRIAAASGDRTRISLDLSEARTRRDNLRAQLEATPETRELRGAAVGVGAEAGAAQRQLQEARRNLDALLQRYTDRHPDVVAARRALAALQDRPVAAANQRQAMVQVVNPVHEQLRLRLADEDTRLSALEGRLEQADAEIDRLRGMAQRALDIEAQFANLNRDYAVIKTSHEQLLARREQARLAQAAEERTDTVQFRIVDPPRLPVEPSAPNRAALFLGVLVGGLAAGAGFTLLLAQFDDSFASTARLREAFELPVLGSVSALRSPAMTRRRIAGAVAFAGAILLLAGTCAGLVAVAHRLPLSIDRLPLDALMRVVGAAWS